MKRAYIPVLIAGGIAVFVLIFMLVRRGGGKSGESNQLDRPKIEQMMQDQIRASKQGEGAGGNALGTRDNR